MWERIKQNFYDECVDSLSECHFNETMHKFRMEPSEVFEWFKRRTEPKFDIPRKSNAIFHATAELRWKNQYARSLENPFTFDVVRVVLQQKWVDVSVDHDEELPFEWRDVPTVDR